MEFGAFVNFFGAKDGLVHISQLAPRRVNKVNDVVKEGDKVIVAWMPRDPAGPRPRQPSFTYKGQEAQSGGGNTSAWADITCIHEQFVVKLEDGVDVEATSIIGWRSDSRILFSKAGSAMSLRKSGLSPVCLATFAFASSGLALWASMPRFKAAMNALTVSPFF